MRMHGTNSDWYKSDVFQKTFSRAYYLGGCMPVLNKVIIKKHTNR